MREPPALATTDIVSAVHGSYGLTVTDLSFLPVGNDASAWAYHLRAATGTRYFLKIRRGPIKAAGLAISHYLADHGLPQVVAPLATQTGSLWTGLAEYTLALYPFIDSRTGRDAGLSDQQWTAFGATLRRLHATVLPNNLAASIKRETFKPAWGAVVAVLDTHIGARVFAEPDEQALAAFWQARRAEILSIVDRAQTLGDRLRAADLPLVPCHADAHTANLLVDSADRLWIVDWDESLLAPKERDLMFIVGPADSGNRTRPRNTELFFRGYGPGDVNRLALAYYRYEWAVQEIGDDGDRVFFKPDTGPRDKNAALREFLRLFEPGRDVAQAYQSGGF